MKYFSLTFLVTPIVGVRHDDHDHEALSRNILDTFLSSTSSMPAANPVNVGSDYGY